MMIAGLVVRTCSSLLFQTVVGHLGQLLFIGLFDEFRVSNRKQFLGGKFVYRITYSRSLCTFNSISEATLKLFVPMYDTIRKHLAVSGSGNFVGMDADESYMDVFMRFP